MTAHFDVAVIGAGIAGASLAFELQRRGARTLLLEREDAPGRHATGRSAALFLKSYGNAAVRTLTLASEPFYTAPPAGFVAQPLLTPRGFVAIARDDQVAKLERERTFAARFVLAVRPLDGAELRQLVPILRPGYARAGFLDPDARDLDVDAILQGYLRGYRANGGALRTHAELREIVRNGATWHLVTTDGAFEAIRVVNAAGAWADEIARLAGVAPLGLVPMRRTAFLVDPPPGCDPAGLPAVADIDEQFYIKGETGRILCSPADETPSPPVDAAAEELDVAIAVERIQCAFELDIRRIRHRWAGLRTFAPDRTPVMGFDPRADGFFWLAGQGGYGIQTAPALAMLAAALLLGDELPEMPGDTRALLEALSPARLSAGSRAGR